MVSTPFWEDALKETLGAAIAWALVTGVMMIFMDGREVLIMMMNVFPPYLIGLLFGKRLGRREEARAQVEAFEQAILKEINIRLDADKVAESVVAAQQQVSAAEAAEEKGNDNGNT